MDVMDQNYEKSKTLLSIEQLSQRHPAFSPSAIRHLIFDAKTNGFDQVIFRVGRKVVLEESAFVNWVLQKNEVEN